MFEDQRFDDTTGAWIWRGWCIACGFLFFSLTAAILIGIGCFALTAMGYHLWG